MQTLFNDLNIQAIIIIEDETTAYNFDRYLAWLVSSEHLLNSLTEADELVSLSSVFLTQFNSSPKKDDIKKQIDFDTPYTDFITQLDTSLQITLNDLNACYMNVNHEVLCWNKLAKLDSNYNNILQIIQEIALPIHYMDNFDYTAEGVEKLTNRLSGYTPESRIFYIVDKTFNGQEKGSDIIDALLKLPILPLSVIFTSKTASQVSNSKDSYFKYEISKDTSAEELGILIEDVSKSCEYVHAISTLSHENTISLAKAEEEILKSKALFSKIIQTAHEEGVSPYEVMNEWLVLSQNYYFSNSMADKLGTIFGSSKIFLDHKPLVHIDTNINQMHFINSFEIFDTHINKKYLPIAPGDIFELNGKYFVLVGQDCDISCRSSSTRKTNVAELLEAEVCDQKQADKAQMLSEQDETCVIYRHFLIIKDGIQKTMQLKVFVNRLRTCPFEMLDLSVYNSDGGCILDTSVDLHNTPMNILPKGQIQKYQIMKDSFKKIYSNYVVLKSFSELTLGHLTYNYFSNNVNITQNGDDFIIDTGFKRIARLKGNFNYFLNKARQDYIGRIALNGIHFNSEHEVFQLKCKYQGDHSVSINAVYDRDQKGWLLNRTELINLLPKIPHFNALPNDYMVIRNSMSKDSATKIDYCLADDIITMDCPIKIVHEGNQSEQYLYGGNNRYTVLKIIEQFLSIKCVNETACESIQNILQKRIKLSDMQQYQIAEFGIVLNFNTTENQLTISKLVSVSE